MHIPSNIEEAREQLTGLEKVLTARHWERAAIVYAFTERPGKDWRAGSMTKLSCSQFAQLGIPGLRSHMSVAHYHDAWKQAIDEGYAADVVPGDDVALPDVERYPFPSHTKAHTPSVQERERVLREATPEDIERVITAEPERFAPTIARTVSNPTVAREVARDRGALEAVEEADIEERAQRPFVRPPIVGDGEDPAQALGNRLSRSFGRDPVVRLIEEATARIAEAAMEERTSGLIDPVGKLEALERHRRYLERWEQGDIEWTSEDVAFLATIGVNHDD